MKASFLAFSFLVLHFILPYGIKFYMELNFTVALLVIEM